jgi:Rad3-related DNA helicase
MPAFKAREGQQTLAASVARAIAQRSSLVAEAGTGTGKTFAYLAPALLSGGKVIISTGTKTLQDQIMEHDLPLLERTLALPVSAVCMKGLGNYLCLRRYHEFASSAEADRAPYAQELLGVRFLDAAAMAPEGGGSDAVAAVYALGYEQGQQQVVGDLEARVAELEKAVASLRIGQVVL